MSDFGQFFDDQIAKRQAREAEARNAALEKEEREARQRKILAKPLDDFLLPALREVERQLVSKGVRVNYEPSINNRTLGEYAVLRKFSLYLTETGGDKLESCTYVFGVFSGGNVECTLNASSAQNPKQPRTIFKLEPFNVTERQIDQVIKMAISDIVDSI